MLLLVENREVRLLHLIAAVSVQPSRGQLTDDGGNPAALTHGYSQALRRHTVWDTPLQLQHSAEKPSVTEEQRYEPGESWEFQVQY